MNADPAAASWRGDLLRALALVALAGVLGLATNALSSRPVPILDPSGPGRVAEGAPRIEPAEYAAEATRGGVLLLDARAERLHAQGRPSGSVAVTPEDLDARMPELMLYLQSARLVVVLCDSAQCMSADRVVEMLEARGYPGAKVFAGGWEGYKQAGFPIE
ncbi:MAG: rhodanese-like domain-containing protein [Planctomycetota bacterium]|nr:rhodanese-like domain-containing protein [Planctomycetota bacterium]